MPALHGERSAHWHIAFVLDVRAYLLLHMQGFAIARVALDQVPCHCAQGGLAYPILPHRIPHCHPKAMVTVTSYITRQVLSEQPSVQQAAVWYIHDEMMLSHLGHCCSKQVCCTSNTYCCPMTIVVAMHEQVSK